MGIDVGKKSEISEENFDDAWKEQHTHITNKWLNQAVFATPIASKNASNKQSTNSYFRHLQTQKFCVIVVSVDEARPTRQELKYLAPRVKGRKKNYDKERNGTL